MLFGTGGLPSDPIAQVIWLVFTFAIVAIFARALLSWFNMDPRSPLIQMLYAITDPILDPIRRLLPTLAGIDFSPLVAIILLQVISARLQALVAG